MPKNAAKYNCEICNFVCSKNSNYVNHLLTTKHKIRSDSCEKMPKNAVKYNCKCGNTYKHASSLWNHRQKCLLNTLPDLNSDKTEEVIPNNKDVMIEKLVEELTSERAEKSEMKSMFMVMMEKYQENTREMQMQNQENTRELLKETVNG